MWTGTWSWDRSEAWIEDWDSGDFSVPTLVWGGRYFRNNPSSRREAMRAPIRPIANRKAM
jgi:hypothetical protein